MVRNPGTCLRGALAVLTVASVLAACGGTSDGPSGDASASAPGTEQVVSVPEDAATITQAMGRVAPGGLVLVGPGTYREKVTITTKDVTLRGTDRNTVVIDAEGRRSYGVLGAADGVRVENLTVTQALLYGVLVTSSQQDGEPLAQGADGYEEIDPDEFPPLQRFRVDHVTAINNGLYGIYAFNAQHGVIADSFTSGSADSGIYVGQCRACDILVEGNVAARNAIGFENANASDSVVLTGNRFSENRVGMTLTSDYQEAFVPQRANTVVGNVISYNDQPDSPRQAQGGIGIGIGIAGGRENVITRNRISGNPQTGVSFSNAEDLPARGNTLTGNVYADNGVDVANVSAERTPAVGNCFEAAAVAAPGNLRATCSAAVQPAAVEGSLATVVEPPGVAFLDVTHPGPQPSLPADATVPEPLPGTVDLPAISSIRLPAPTLLGELLQGFR